MSTSSPSATSGAKKVDYPDSLWRFCQPYLHANDWEGQNALSQYLGPVNDSEAFLAALAAHEAGTPANMMSHANTTNLCRLARPREAGEPGVLIELNTTRRHLRPRDPRSRADMERPDIVDHDRTILTLFTYYGKNEPKWADTHEELRNAYSDLTNMLTFAAGTRNFVNSHPDQICEAADEIFRCLVNHPDYGELNDGTPRTEGRVAWVKPHELVMLDFPPPPSSGRSNGLRWTFTENGLSTYIPRARPVSNTPFTASRASPSTYVASSRGSSSHMSGSQRR